MRRKNWVDIDLSKTQKYLDWLKRKLYLDKLSEKSKTRVVKRGQVYWCDFGIGIGSEMSKESPRPGVILQKTVINKNSPNTIVAPITHDKGTIPCLIPIREYFDTNGKRILDGQVNVSNIMCISKGRLSGQICQLDSKEVKEIDNQLMQQLDIYKPYYDMMMQLSSIRNKLQISESDDILAKLQEMLDKIENM